MGFSMSPINASNAGKTYFEVKYSVKSQPGTERYSIEIAALQDIVRRQEILELNITPKPSSQHELKALLF